MKHELNFFITDNMTGSLNTIKPTAVLDIFQSLAGSHVKLLGLSADKMISSGYAWVLQSVKYEKIADLKSETYVKGITVPRKPVGVFYDRDYLIQDEKGNVLIKGTSRWVIVNMKTRKIELEKRFSYPENEFCEQNLQKEFGKPDRLRVSETDMVKIGEYAVRKSETDILGHMNNTRYADLIFNYFPESLKSLEIEYVKEIKAGECVSVYKKEDGCKTYVLGLVNGEKRFVSRFGKEA